MTAGRLAVLMDALAVSLFKYGNDFFSTKMLVATLSYTENVAKAVLHSFRLLRILDCHKDGVNMYQFRVNPEDNPECFEPAA